MVEYSILKPPPRRRRRVVMAVGTVVLVAAVALGAFAIGKHARPGGPAAHAGGAATTAPPTVTALTVVSTSPAAGATNIPSDQVVTVRLSSPIARGSAMPTLTPPVGGTWLKVGPATLSFAATAPFIPTTTETLTVPAGAPGLRGTSGGLLATPVSASFTITQASTERLQQLLAQLGYLPLSYTPAAPLASPVEAVTAQTGTFAWRWAGVPDSLASQWTEGSENVITKGAVMNFENQHGLTVDGLVGRRVWTALLSDVATGRATANPYTYVFVSKQLPQALTLFENGSPTIVDVPVNTGAPGADTVDGTYPVFEHITSSRMKGTNPDGTTYDDPSVPWASYFNGGDALHGFVRATYGSPQSNGCVEMAIADAARVWPLTPIGTLVTVVGPAS